jgi:glycosyltransferase involved in cell wall biosynthesis
MRRALDGERAQHRLLTIFASEHHELNADVQLDVRKGLSGRLGLDVGAVSALRGALQRLQPSCVVAHGSQPLKYLVCAAPRALPIIAYRLGIAHAGAHRASRRLFHAALYRRTLRVAGVSDECLEEARDLFWVPRARTVLIPNGRDPEQFRPATEQRRGPPKLLFVGHMTASKRPAFFLDVVEQLRAKAIAFDAQLVGDGPLLSTLRARAERLGVDVLGHRADVADLLQKASVLAFTSIPDGEGMPGVFIEAGLCGVPVVTTDVPGARTVISEGETGYVVGVEHTAEFAQRAARLLDSPNELSRMGAAARARCQAEFTLSRSVDRWVSLLNELFPELN